MTDPCVHLFTSLLSLAKNKWFCWYLHLFFMITISFFLYRPNLSSHKYFRKSDVNRLNVMLCAVILCRYTPEVTSGCQDALCVFQWLGKVLWIHLCGEVWDSPHMFSSHH